MGVVSRGRRVKVGKVKAEEVALLGLVFAIISAIAAAISARSAHVAVQMQRRSVEPSLTVSLTFSVAAAGGESLPFASLTVANSGLIPVDVTSVGLVPAGGGTMPIMSPKGYGNQRVLGWLEPGRAVTAVLEIAELARGHQRAPGGINGAFANTAANGTFKGDANVPAILRKYQVWVAE